MSAVGIAGRLASAVAGLWSGRFGARASIAVAAIAVLALAGAAPALAEECPGTGSGETIAVWGDNANGKLGAGYESKAERAPIPATTLTGVHEVQAGFEFEDALVGATKVGAKEVSCTIWAWGNNWRGELGDGNFEKAAWTPAVVRETKGEPLEGVVEMAMAGDHALARRSDNTIWTWGASEFGNRGNGENGYELTAREHEPEAERRDVALRIPVVIENKEEEVKQIALGGPHDYALLASGKVVAWGEDRQDQLGLAPKAETQQCYGEGTGKKTVPCITKPRLVETTLGHPLEHIKAIYAGQLDAYAVPESGETIYAWGDNSKGELWTSPAETEGAVELSFASLGKGAPTDIAGGNDHALAVFSNGEVYGWGADTEKQLGTNPAEAETCGGQACATKPVRVPLPEHAVRVVASANESAAVVEEGGKNVVYTWGLGRFGALGIGFVEGEERNQREVVEPTPTPIRELASVNQLAIASVNAIVSLAGKAPKPVFSLTPGELAFETSWDLPAPEEFKNLRYRPVGTGVSSFKNVASPCSAKEELEKHGCSHTITGLKAFPYEVALNSESPEKLHGNGRKYIVAPNPPAGYPKDEVPPSLSGGLLSEESGETYLHVGSVATANHGEWTNASSYTYTWLQCAGLGVGGSIEELGTECSEITSGSSESYFVTEATRYHSLAVRVAAKNGSEQVTEAVSPGILVLGAGEETPPGPPHIPGSNAIPTITGSTAPGESLTAEHGGWTGTSESPEYEDLWETCKWVVEEKLEVGGKLQTLDMGSACRPVVTVVEGEKVPYISSKYSTEAGQLGRYVEVIETAHGPGGAETSRSPARLIRPTAETELETAPALSPVTTIKYEKGAKLSLTLGKWKSERPGTQVFHWRRCWFPKGGGERCERIAKAEIASEGRHEMELSEGWVKEHSKIHVEETQESWGGTTLTSNSNIVEVT